MTTARRSPNAARSTDHPQRISFRLIVAIALTAMTASAALDAGILMSVNTPAASPGVAIQITGTGFSTTASHNLLTVTPASGSPRTSTATAVQTLDSVRGIRRLNVLVPSGLPAGAATLRVTNAATGEISEGLSFQVVELTASGTTIAPPGTSGVQLVLEGSSNAAFTTDGNTRVSAGAGVTVRTVTVQSPQRLIATLDIAASAALGPRAIAVRPPNQLLAVFDGFTVGTPPPVNRSPRITSAPVVDAIVGQAYAYSLQAVDDDGDPVTFALQQGPAGLTLSGSSLQWTPASAQVGSHQVTVIASDGRGGTNAQGFQIIVAAPPITGIAVVPSNLRFTTLQDTRQLSVVAQRADGSTIDVTAAVTGTTYQTSNGAVATAGSDGLVAAVANGQATITARHLAFSAAATVVVEQGVALDALELLPASSTLRASAATQALLLRGRFSDGSQRDLTADPAASFTTSDAAIAVVSDAGIVTAVADGIVTVTATFEGRTASADVRVAIPAGQGFVRGQVFDDARGLPLEGARVSLLSDGGGPYDEPPFAVTDERGRFVLPARRGEVIVRASKAGFTSVDRQGPLGAAGILRLLDARLTPIDATNVPMRSAFGGELRSAAAGVTVALQPGALASDAAFRLTAVSAQGLAGRLPGGWSPVFAVDVAPAVTLHQAATLSVPNAATIPASTSVVAVAYDTDAHLWRVIGAAQASLDGRTLSITTMSLGPIAFVVADEAPFTPPQPVAAQPLGGVDLPLLPAVLDATGDVVPRSAPPGEGARAVGRVALTSPQALPSGTAIQVHVNETFDLIDGGTVMPLPFTQDILVHARPRPPSSGRLGAAFPITPTRSYTIQQLMHGVIRLDVVRPASESPVSTAGPEPATITNDAGDVLIIPAGALATETPISLHRITTPTLPPGVPATHQVVAALDVELVGEFAAPARLSIARPSDVPTGDQVVVAQRILDATGIQRLRIVGTGVVEGDRLLSQHTVGSLQLAGVTAGAQYLFIRVPEPLGFVTGIVTGPDGTTPAASVLVTTDTMPYADVTAGAGRYLVGAPLDRDTRVAALHLHTLDTTQGVARPPSPNGITTLPLSLAVVPPSVISTDPASGATNVPVDVSIAVDFSEAIDAASITPQSVTLQAAGVDVAVTRTLSQNGRRLTLRPVGPLAPRTTFTLVLTTAIRDVSGAALLPDAPRTFSTLDPTRAPQPAPGRIRAALPDDDGLVAVAGVAGAAEPRTAVTATNLRTQETVTVMALEDGSFRLWIAALLGDEITLTLRDSAGRETTIAVHQFDGQDGSTSIGVHGGQIVGPDGRVGSIVPRALTAAGIFRIGDPSDDAPTSLPSGFSYADRFSLQVSGAAFNRVVSLRLTEGQGRLDATASADPFVAQGELTVPADFLAGAAVRYTASAQDAGGNRRSVSLGTMVVPSAPDRTAVEEVYTADFPTIVLSAPRESVPGQLTGARAEAAAARIDLQTDAPPVQAGADIFLLTRSIAVGQEIKLAVVDRLARDGDGRLRTAARELPGMSAPGEYAIVRSDEPLVFITGTLPGAAGFVEVDGLPFVVDTGGPHGTFSVPARAGVPFTLRLLASDGSLQGTFTGEAPASGSIDVGSVTNVPGATLRVSVEPADASTADIAAPLVFRFSSAMDARTLPGIVVTDDRGHRIFGRFSIADDGSTVRFVPARRWRFAARYRYGIGTTVVGLDGARFPAPQSGSFTTFAPGVIGSAAIGDVEALGGAMTLAAAASSHGLSILETSSPRAPARLGHVASAGTVRAVAYSPALTLTTRTGERRTGTFAAALLHEGDGLHLQLFGLDTPFSPVPLGRISLQGPVPSGIRADLEIVGTRAVVAVEDRGVIAVDLGQLVPDAPADPGAAIVAVHPSNGAADISAITLLGSRVVVAGAQGLRVLNGTDLSAVSSLAAGELRHVAAAGDFVMDVNGDGSLTGDEVFDLGVASGGADGALQFFRLGREGAPALLSIVRLGGAITSVSLDASRRIALVGLGGRGLAIVDLDGPATLQPIDQDRDGVDDRILGIVETHGSVRDAVPLVERGLALVADGPSGVAIVQVEPVRSRVLAIRRDPSRAVTGDEQDVTLTREALTTDDAVIVDVDASSPDGSTIVAVVSNTTTTGGPVFSLGEQGSSIDLRTGLHSIALAIDRARARDGDVAVLSLRTAAGAPVLSIEVRLRSPGTTEAVPVSLRIVPERVELDGTNREASVTLLATLADGRVVNVSSGTATSYRVEETSVATVSPDGIVHAFGGGSTVLNATFAGLTASAVVVVDAPARIIALEAISTHVTLTGPGQTAPLPIRVRFSDGSEREGNLAGLGIEFASSSPSIVAVDPDGRVTAAAEGTAAVTASHEGRSLVIQMAVAFRTAAAVSTISLQPFDRPAGTDVGFADARAVLTGTGSLEGLDVTFTVDGDAVIVRSDYNGVASARLSGLRTVGTFLVTASIADPATGATRSSAQPLQVIASGQDVEPNDTLAEAVPVNLRTFVSGGVSAGDAADFYRLTSAEGGVLTVAVRTPASSASTLRLRLLDLSGNTLAEATGGSGTIRLAHMVSPGSFITSIEHLTGEPTYRLSADLDQAPAIISAVTPLAGPPGTNVTITGSGFSTDPRRNAVYFGKVAARVVSSTETSIETIVPAAAVDGPVDVVAGARRASGPSFVAGRTGRPEVRLEPHAPAALRHDPVIDDLLVVNRLNVYVDPGTTRAEVEALASAQNGRIAGVNEVLSRYVLEFADVTTLPAIHARLRALSTDPRVRLVNTYGFLTLDQSGVPDYRRAAGTDQVLAQIGLVEAFDAIRRSERFRQGLRPVRVAVFESGFDPNPYAADFQTSTGTPLWSMRLPIDGTTFDSYGAFDRLGHGTSVVGLIAALNNGNTLSGVLGSFFTPETANFDILVYGFDSPQSTEAPKPHFPLSLGVDGITEIGLLGNVDVLNLSLGANRVGDALERLREEFRLALLPLAGRTLVVASSGNEGAYGATHMPSGLEDRLPFVIAVGGTATVTRPDHRVPKSRWRSGGVPDAHPDTLCESGGLTGSGCAPGVNIAAPAEQIPVLRLGAIEKRNGVSYATPLVSGTAALLIALRGTNPAMAPDQLRNHLVQTAEELNHHTWGPPGMRLLNIREAVRDFVDAPSNQRVFVADQDAVSTPNGTGRVVAMEVDPLAGTPSQPTTDLGIPLVLERDGETFRFRHPGSIAMDPAGQWTYVVASAEDASLGDGILVISTARNEIQDFIAFSGAPLRATPGIPRPPPVRSSSGRRTIVPSRDGRLLYAATGLSITIVNLAEGRVVRRLADLPAVYAGGLHLVDPDALAVRRDALAGLLTTPIAGRPPVAITSLDMSSNGTVLFGAVSTGGGAGLQPGAILRIEVNLYADVTALQFGLQTDLGQFFVNPTLSPMAGTPGTASPGDEPSVVVAGQTNDIAYLVNGGLDGYTTVTGTLEYALLIDLFGVVQLGQIEGDIGIGSTVVRALGQTGLFTSSAGALHNTWTFPANLNVSMRPPNARPVTHLPGNSPEVFASRPFSMAMRPDGRRAILPMFQTGNIGVVDLDVQTRLQARNPALASLPADAFHGLVGVSEALKLDAHLWPSCGVIGSGLNADVPSPDEALLFAWDAVYAQNGRFAIVTHSGTGAPRQVSGTIPDFSQPPGSFVVAQLGYQVSGTTAVDAQGRSITAGDTVSFMRGGGAITFVDDQALSDALAPDGLRERTPLPTRSADATSPAACPSLRGGRVLGYGPSPTVATRFHRPRGVGIQPFVYFESPRHGDHIAASQPLYMGWRDPRVTRLQLSAEDLDTGEFAITGLPLTPPDVQARSVSIPLTDAFGAEDFEPGQRLRLTLIAHATLPGTGAEEELSRTFIDVTISDGGGALSVEMTPPLVIVPVVPNPAPRHLTVTLHRPDGSSANVSADAQFRWIGQGLSEAGEPAFGALRVRLAQALGVPTLPVATLTVSPGGALLVQQPGMQLIRATYQGIDVEGPVVVLAGFDLRAIEIDPQAPLTRPITLTDHLRAQEANAPLLLAADGARQIPDRSEVVLSKVRLGFAGQGQIDLDVLLEALGTVVHVEEEHTTAGRLHEFLRLAGVTGLDGFPLTYSVVGPEGATAPAIDLTCPVADQTATCVNARASGTALVRGVLDLTPAGLGRAVDDVLAVVLPPIESAAIEPPTAVIRRSDSPSSGPAIKSFATLGTLADARFTRPADVTTTDVFAARWLPPSWLASGGHVALEIPAGPSVRFTFGIQRTTADVTISALQTVVAVPNDAAPDVVSTYTVDDPTIATLTPIDSYRMRVRHQNVAGTARVTNPIAISGLGSATATADLVVCDCTGLALVKRLTSASTTVAAGDLVSYEITAANGTSVPVSNVVITDELRFGQLLVSRTSLPAFSLGPGESRSFPIQVVAPFYGTTIHNTATAPGFSAVQPPPVTVLAPASTIVISEMVLNPQRDWNDTAGGNGVPFDAVPGNGAVDSGDIWIEVTNATTATQNWTIRITDAAGATASRPIGPISLSGGQVRVLSGFIGVTLPIVRVEVVDAQGVVRQVLDIQAIEQALGGATGTANEALSWSVFGSPTGGLQQFTRGPATPGAFLPF